MSTPAILKKLGEDARSLPPDENEQQALREKQANIDAVAPRAAVPVQGLQPVISPAPFEKVNQGPYGSRPGEQLYKVDSEGNISPIPMQHIIEDKDYPQYQVLQPIQPMEQKRTAVKPIIPSSLSTPMVENATPIYDEGGDVTIVPKAKKPTMEVHGDEKNYSDSEQVAKRPAGPSMPKIEMNTVPLYDDGGDVDVNDGQHQVAILKEGERVLTPEEAAAYKKEHPEQGAPVDFPGRVLPNPKSIKPILDTDVKPKGPKPVEPVEATMHAELPTSKVTPQPKEEAPADFTGRKLPNPKGLKPILDTEAQPKTDEPVGAQMDTSNGLNIESGATDFRESSLKPYSQVLQDRANEQVAKMQPATATAQPAPEEKPKLTGGHLLADQWLKMVIPPPPALPEQPLGERQGPGLQPIAMPTAAAPLSGKEAFHQKMQDYKTAYQEAMDKAAATNDPSDREQAARIKEAMLSYEKEHGWGTPESAHPGILGKLGHVGERVAARTPLMGISQITASIPGSEAARGAETAAAQGQVKEANEENTAETKAAKVPKPFPGDNLVTEPDGTRKHLYQNPDGSTQWVKEGEAPKWPVVSPATAPVAGEGATAAGVPVPKAQIGEQPNIVAAANTANAANQPAPGSVYGKPPVPKEGDLPATDAQLNDVATRLKNNPYVSPDAAKSLQFPEGYKPTQNDVKERLANIKEIEDATRQGKQDDAMNALRKLQEQNQSLMTQAHLLDLQDKHQQAEAKEAMNASVSLAGLYAQQNYKDEMDKWYKSGNFAKDSGLVTEIVNAEKSDNGAFNSAMGDTLVGSLFGPEGAAIGAGVGALTGLVAGPANGYLETLKKQGISEEGYKAMQAYFNALPARMAYEISVQGVSASAMRNAQVIRKVLNTVPPPNTPQESFDPNFDQYYKPMDVLTKKKVELSAPKNYVPPKKEDFYPPKPNAPEKAVRPSGIPDGATKIYRDKEKKVVGYALDGKYHALTTTPAAK